MELECKSLRIWICTEATIPTALPLVKELTTGQTKVTSKVTSSTVSEKAKGSGKKDQENAISTKATTRIIKNGDTVNSHGKVVTSTKEIMKEMCGVATEKCTG